VNAATLETWVRSIVEAVTAGRFSEDSLVELKAQWPQPSKMASKLAGHANAARGDSILWLIGLDEKHGVVGAPSERLEDWYPQVQSEFDAGLAPTLEKDLNVQTDEGQLVALVFRTDRVPYLVKNADARGGEPAYWVPWREGRRTRAARHSDLIKVLLPVVRGPLLEAVGASMASLGVPPGAQPRVQVNATLFVYKRSAATLVFPTHRASATIDFGGGRVFEASSVDLAHDGDRGQGALVLQESGRFHASCDFSGLPSPVPESRRVTLRLGYSPDDSPAVVVMDFKIHPEGGFRLFP
jgi:hypothetical protein